METRPVYKANGASQIRTSSSGAPYRLLRTQEGNILSLYNDEPANNAQVLTAAGALQTAFRMSEEFKNVLINRIIANNMTSQQLADAVGYVIDHKRWDTFQIADIVSWNRTVKFYSYEEYTIHPSGKVGISITDDIRVWVDTTELAQKGLKIENGKITRL